MDIAWLIAGGVVVTGAVIAVLIKKRHGQVFAMRGNTSQAMTPYVATLSNVVETPTPPMQLLLTVEDEPVFALNILDAAEAGERMEGAARCEPSAFGRALEPLMQVAPSMATASMAGSRQLMEVVINGPLVAAADGNGFRAMTMGANGIQQNARLFEPTALQNVANAAALWQLASVAVAQKHLADISATLKRVEGKVAGIQSMLEEERAALIDGALKYIDSARQAMQKGEFLDRTRDKLEDFEIQLERAGTTLLRQIERESKRGLDRDTVGCEGEYQSALAKHQALSARAAELVACAEVRLANWYLCSLYPDRSKMLESRMQYIREFAAQIASTQALLASVVETDCRNIDAVLTSAEKIEMRREDVRIQASQAKGTLKSGIMRCEAIIARVQMVSDDRNSTSRLLIEVDGKVPTTVYLTHDKSALPSMRIQNEELVSCL